MPSSSSIEDFERYLIRRLAEIEGEREPAPHARYFEVCRVYEEVERFKSRARRATSRSSSGPRA